MFALLAVCAPLVICTPTIAEQIEHKRVELRTLDVARNEANFAFNQNMQKIGRERAEAHRSGVETYDDTDALHAAVAAHVAAQDHFDEQWDKAETHIRTLECRLELARSASVNAKRLQEAGGARDAAANDTGDRCASSEAK